MAGQEALPRFDRRQIDHARDDPSEAGPDRADEGLEHRLAEALALKAFGLDTIVGDRGTRLSGGQRQRVALARAFLKDAPLLLLDEATSSLDSESEAAIRETLERLMRGRTVIAITHRLLTVGQFDRILVMQSG